ncbi:HNH endonuclease [Sphaerisporangium sp. NPDC004334]
MIRIYRVDLPPTLTRRLVRRTNTLRQNQADGRAARTAWKNADGTRTQITMHLAEMAPGIKRCMYCGDSLGTSIDHFEPLAEAPLRAFDWQNHYLACSHCNSNHKRELFPRDRRRLPLLIDPCTEDPFDHLRLMLREGHYDDLTAKGRATIDTFGLNREDLKRGRSHAFVQTRSLLRNRVQLLNTAHGAEEANEIAASLRDQPFADVLYAMLRYRKHREAARLLRGEDIVDALDDPELHFWPKCSTG